MAGRVASREASQGFVALVGAGPGHPGLLTLRGRDCLASCDVVLYDGLSNTEMLRHAAHAEHICVGKHGQSRIWKQSEIIDEMLRHAVAGRYVVRLKGGDPAVFARTSEEVDSLRGADVPFEIVPGITAALAAGSYAGIPITHRGVASAVALVTGHEQPDKNTPELDWAALARFPGTLVIYMGVTTARHWTSALIAGGLEPATPCAILRRCSMPDQQRIACRLDEVAEHLTPATKLRPPVITIVGPVTELAESMDWFSCRPLHGRRILVTRPDVSSDRLVNELESLGAELLLQPAIEISRLADQDAIASLDGAIELLPTRDWVVFCSRNGVEHFLRRCFERGHDARQFAGVRLAAVGPATAEALARWHLRADYVPERFDADELLAGMIGSGEDSGQPGSALVVRASRGRDSLAEPLRRAGWRVDEVVAYQHTDVAAVDPEIASAMRAGRVDWITLTSSATATNLAKLLGEDWLSAQRRGCRVAVISERTGDAVRSLGLNVDAIANEATISGLINAMIDHESRDHGPLDHKPRPPRPFTSEA